MTGMEPCRGWGKGFKIRYIVVPPQAARTKRLILRHTGPRFGETTPES